MNRVSGSFDGGRRRRWQESEGSMRMSCLLPGRKLARPNAMVVPSSLDRPDPSVLFGCSTRAKLNATGCMSRVRRAEKCGGGGGGSRRQMHAWERCCVRRRGVF